MPFEILYGYPDIENIMKDLLERKNKKKLGKDELKYLKKIVKCFAFLSQDPTYPSLNSHKIDVLSKKTGVDIWESYLENHTPSAGRIFWLYGPKKGQITIAAIEPHPEKNAYSKVSSATKSKPAEKAKLLNQTKSKAKLVVRKKTKTDHKYLFNDHSGLKRA